MSFCSLASPTLAVLLPSSLFLNWNPHREAFISEETKGSGGQERQGIAKKIVESMGVCVGVCVIQRRQHQAHESQHCYCSKLSVWNFNTLLFNSCWSCQSQWLHPNCISQFATWTDDACIYTFPKASWCHCSHFNHLCGSHEEKCQV